MKIRHLILLALFLIISESAHCNENGKAYQIRLDKEGWGNGSPNDIEAVLYSACDSIHEHFAPLKENEPIRVIRDKSGPITLFQRNLRGEIIVKINTGDRYWCQYSATFFVVSVMEVDEIYGLKNHYARWLQCSPSDQWKKHGKQLLLIQTGNPIPL
jgi:hypothetical protein